MADEQTNLNLLTDFYFPIRDQEKIFSSNAYKVLSDNNIDTAELLGVTQNPNSHSIQLRNDADPSFKDKAKENAKDFTQGLVNFISDIPNEMQMKSVEGVMQAGKLGVNLMPILNKLSGSPFDENTVMDKAISWNKSINDKVTQFRDIYKQGYQIAEGRDPNGLAEFAGWIAQDYPYSAGIYKGLKQVGVSDSAALILSVGLGSAISFDPKETSVSLNLFTQEIASIKKYLDIIPDTPNSELFDRTVQLFEGTALAKAIPVLFDTAKFLKKNIPSFVPGAAVATAASTAIGEVTDQTILNPKEEITPQTTDGLNQNQSMLNTIKSGVDQFGNKLTEIGGAIKKEFSGEAMANPLVSKGVNELAPKLAPVFKSAVVDAVEKIPNKAPGNQILGTIKNIQGVTQQEMKWIGLDDFLKDKPSVTKQELSDFIQANRLDVNEVMLPRKTSTKKSDNEVFEWFKNQNEDTGDSAYYAYKDIQNALAENGGIRFDDINYNLIKNSYSRKFNYNTQRVMSDTGLYDEFFYSGEILPIEFFRGQIQNQYRIGDIYFAKSKKKLTEDEVDTFVRNFITEEEDNFRYKHSTDVDYSDVKKLLFSDDDFMMLKDRIKKDGLKMKNEEKIFFDEENIKKLHNEYVIRLEEDNIYNRYEFDFKDIEEFVGGSLATKYGNYTLPGGENYKELIFTLSKGGQNVGDNFPLQQGATTKQTTDKIGLDTSPHMNIKGEFAHVRFKERDIAGQKTLAVEELQSDIFQKVKQENKRIVRQGIQDAKMESAAQQNATGIFENVTEQDILQKAKPFIEDNTITDFPFKNNWYELATRRLIRYAADNNFEAIAIPEGRVAAARYGKVGGFADNIEISVFRNDSSPNAKPENYAFTVTYNKGNKEIAKRVLRGDAIKELEKQFPKSYENFNSDILDILNNKYTKDELIENSFNYKLSEKQFIGEGKGKFELYDQAIPAYMKKYAKKWNAPITTEQVKFREQNETINYTVLKITPEMKRSVQDKSQPLFNIVLPALSAGGGAKVISDSIGNNTISEPTKNQ